MAGQEKRNMASEEELLRRCARGEGSAYRDLVERLEKPLVNFITRYVGERHVAEDLFQETFVRVVRTLGSFRPEATLSTWVFTIARNLALDHLKSRKRRREVSLDAPAAGEPGKVIPFKEALRSVSNGPGTKAESAELERRVTAALGALAPAKREALTLRLYAGLAYTEIAKITGAPTGTVKFRVHEALKDLAKLMGADGASIVAQGG